MKPAWGNRLKTSYAAIEESAGVLCPLLVIMSVVPELASFRAIALISLWFGCGHTLLHFYDVYPALRFRPFYKGLFAFGAGICWPVWFLPGSPVGR
jgi:hypothetical protein